MRLTQQAAIEHRIAGALLGVAAGDALGATVEFASPEQIARRFPAGHREIVGGGPFGWRPGQGTDDTDLTMALVRAYLAPEGFSLERAAEEFLAWFDAGPRDVGGTTAAALAAYRRDRDLATCGQRHERSAANGSLMRCIATGLVRADAGLRRREAAAISRITHAERRCVESCVAYCDLVSALLDGMPPRSAVAWVAEHAPVSDDVRAVIADAPAAAIDTLPTTGYVFDALRAAVWALCQPTAPEDTLVAVVARGGDADTVGAVVGGLLGAAHGADGLPARWVQRLEYAPEIAAAVPRLAALRTGATPHRRLWRLDAARPAPAPRPARQLPGRLVTVDCDGTLFDSWACCGKRAASWEGDPGCAHLRGDVLDDARRLAAAHDAGLAVLSWRPGADAVTRRWLARVGLDEEFAAVFVPGGADDCRPTASGGQAEFKVATVRALAAAGVEVVAALDDNAAVVAALAAAGVRHARQVPHLVDVAPHEWAAGYLGAPKPAAVPWFRRHRHRRPRRLRRVSLQSALATGDAGFCESCGEDLDESALFAAGVCGHCGRCERCGAALDDDAIQDGRRCCEQCAADDELGAWAHPDFGWD